MGLAMAAAIWGLGCATASELSPPPSAAHVASAEAAVKTARQAPEEGVVGAHARTAEKELLEAKERLSRGDNRAGALMLARAEADAELAQVLRRRERALAEAEVIEGQLAETKGSGPAAGAAVPAVPAVPAAPGLATPGSATPAAATPVTAAPASTTATPTSVAPSSGTPAAATPASAVTPARP